MSIFGSLDVSASALSAERLRMDVTAENLANAQSTRSANGGPYRRKEVVLQSTGGGSGFAGALAAARGGGAGGAARGSGPDGGVQVSGIVEDQTPNRLGYDPRASGGDAPGVVSIPKLK